MKKKIALQPGDRDYFRILTEFAFRNPFEKESLELAYKVAGGEYPAGEQLRSQVFETIKKKIRQVTLNGKFTWKQFAGEDRNLVRFALLHDSYYRCFSKFDDLILRQIKEDLQRGFLLSSLLQRHKCSYSASADR